jgi:hypothetical protein
VESEVKFSCEPFLRHVPRTPRATHFRLCDGAFSSLTPVINALQRCAILTADVQLDDAASVHSRNSRRERRYRQSCVSIFPTHLNVPSLDFVNVVSPTHSPWHLHYDPVENSVQPES